MIRLKLAIFGGGAAVAVCALALPAGAWGPHPVADAARTHLIEAIRDMEQVAHDNPQGSFGGHEGRAISLARESLAQFEQGMQYRARLP